MLKDTCEALWAALVEDHMPVPSTKQLKRVKLDFFTHWNFRYCVETIDGKHYHVKCPPNTGTQYYKNKKLFSAVLQGVADAEYKFITTEVGGRGIQSDGGIFSASTLYECLESNQFNIPPDQELQGATVKLPNVLLRDEAHPLKT
jgi:hypothetical protein